MVATTVATSSFLPARDTSKHREVPINQSMEVSSFQLLICRMRYASAAHFLFLKHKSSPRHSAPAMASPTTKRPCALSTESLPRQLQGTTDRRQLLSPRQVMQTGARKNRTFYYISGKDYITKVLMQLVSVPGRAQRAHLLRNEPPRVVQTVFQYWFN